jgi:hypothetical protein
VEWFLAAERYHWTPEQYDALPLDFAELLPDMTAGWDQAVRRANESATRHSGSPPDPGIPRFTGGMHG